MRFLEYCISWFANKIDFTRNKFDQKRKKIKSPCLTSEKNIFIHKRMLTTVAKRITANLILSVTSRITAKFLSNKDVDHPCF